jgi:Zn-dependent protease
MSGYQLSRPRRGAVRPSPLFLTFVAVTAVGALLAWTQSGRGSRIGDFGVLVFIVGGWVISVCFHEFAHAYTAYRSGDRGVETAGYLTLNPFKYAHPVLSILLPLLFIIEGGIGLPGGAVYLHPHTFRSRGMRSLAAAVGPAVNVVLAIVLLLVAKSHIGAIDAYLGGSDAGHARFWAAIAFLGFLQTSAAVLNLLPVPGLDGYAIIEPYLDPETVRLGQKVKPFGMLAVLVLIAYVNQINRVFFQFIGWLSERTGANQLLWEAGRQFFRFWAKPPF